MAVSAGCSRPSADDVAAKIESREQLGEGDYDAMLSYLEEATQSQLPEIRNAQTWDDLQKIDAESQRRYPYADMFATALLHDYPKLTAKQTERMAEMRRDTRDASSRK